MTTTGPKITSSHVNIQKLEERGGISLPFFYQEEWGLSVSQFPPGFLNQGRKLFFTSDFPLYLIDQNWVIWLFPNRKRRWQSKHLTFHSLLWEIGSASLGSKEIGYQEFAVHENSVINVQVWGVKYLPQITMLLKCNFLNSHLVGFWITVTGGTVVFNHNFLFLRKLSISWDLISSHLLGTGLFGGSDEKWWLLLDDSEQFQRSFHYTELFRSPKQIVDYKWIGN